MSAASTLPRPRGLRWGRLLAGAGALGAAVGVVLALVQIASLPDVEADAERLAAQATQGRPLRDTEAPSDDPFAPPPAAVGGLPVYPGVTPRALDPKNLAAAPMAIAWFETADSPAEVMAFYEKALQAEGIGPSVTRHSEQMMSLGYLDPPQAGNVEEGLLHHVSAVAQGGRTLVFVSGLVPEQLLQARHQLPAGLRLPLESTPPQVMNVGDVGAEHQVIYATLQGMPLESSLSFFKKSLREDGWTVTDENTGVPERAGLSARRESGALAVALESSAEGTLVLMTHEARGQTTARPLNENEENEP